MRTDKIVIPRWFDRHVHLRDEDMLAPIIRCFLNQQVFGIVAMGNLKHPDETSSIEKAEAYSRRIAGCLAAMFAPREWNCELQPCMTLYLTDSIEPEEVVRGFEEGVWCAGKLYIAGQGGTTNSGNGVKDLRGRYPVFAAMEKARMPLLGHFEAVEPDIDEFDREVVSLERDLIPLLDAFPDLRVVVEHVTDGRMADFVAQTNHNVRATVTAHHLMINRNAMFAGGMCPINYCKPVPKRENHRLKIRKYVTSGNPRFGAGTDSAPHEEPAKSKPCGCAAGIFTAPVATELYTTVFDEDNAMEHLCAFLSENFLDFYGLKPSKETMTLVREPTKIPEIQYPRVRVFMGGQTLPWKLVR